MKQFRRSLSPLSAAVLLGLATSSHAVTYKITTLGVGEYQTEEFIHTYALDGNSQPIGEGVVVGAGNSMEVVSASDGDLDSNDNDYLGVGVGGVDLNQDPGTDEQDYLMLHDEDLKHVAEFAGSYMALYNNSLSEWVRVHVWDVRSEIDGEYLGTTNDFFYGANERDVMVGAGSAPYHVVEWIDDTVGDTRSVVRDFGSRAFVFQMGEDPEDGERTALMPEFTQYGGYSVANDINNSNLVVGHSSVSFSAAGISLYNACRLTDQSRDLCETQVGGAGRSSYNTEAFAWELDGNLNIIESEPLGSLLDLSQGIPSGYQSTAIAVNENGYAVGSSHGYSAENDPRSGLLEYAAIYTKFSGHDEGVLDITNRIFYNGNQGGMVSRAVDINDNDVVVGWANRIINGVVRSKAFYYDIRETGIGMVEIPAPFTSSSMTAKSINNHGQVVGEYEWEARPGASNRRRHAYLYEIDTGAFLDLNNAIGCDPQWEVVEANVIRDDGVILATATRSEPILNSRGEPIFDSNGHSLNRVVARAVALEEIPNSGSFNCESGEVTVPENDREGAGVGFLLLTLPVFGWIRRCYKKKL